jgi:hypothetical protein
MPTYTSMVVPFNPPNTVTISNFYINRTNTLVPNILPVTVTFVSNMDYLFTIGTLGNSFSFDFNPITNQLTNIPFNVSSVITTATEFTALVKIIITLNPNIPGLSSYQPGSIYTIYPQFPIPAIITTFGVLVTVTVNPNFSINTANSTTVPLLESNAINNNIMVPHMNNNNDMTNNVIHLSVPVPTIIIDGQTTINGENLADFIFTIKDIYTYYCYDKKHVKNLKTGNVSDFDLKTTKLYKYYICLQEVIKGKGETLREKLYFQYNGIYFQSFYENIIYYAIIKYILTYLLYGEFNLKYLLCENNKKFFKDLKHSRFREFIQVFEENNFEGYIKYFK